MDWDDLHYILKVAETGDLSPAGRFLRVNAATVVRHIEALEEASGRRLFVRTQRGYGLMEAGERLLQWSPRGGRVG
ncbi:MAG: LysR family transcriptional regulator, partial [Rhodopila sp.]